MPLLIALASLLVGGAAAPTIQAGADVQGQARARDRDADRSRAQDAGREIERLRSQLVGMGREEASGERTEGGARDQLLQLSTQEAELKMRMGRNQEALTRLLGALQMFQRNPPPPLLVDPRSARDAVRAAILIRAITPDLEARAKAFAVQSEALKRLRRKADEASGVLFQVQSAEAERQARMEDVLEQKRALEKQLYADADTADADVRRLAGRSPSLGAFVNALESQKGDKGQVSAPAPVSFVAPVQGVVSRRFGQPGPDRLGGGRLHAKGWTWTADPGAVVLSPVAGSVDYAGPLKDWGLVLILDVGDHRVVLAGLASVDIATGRTVAAGEPVGRMGAGPDRPDLYLEVRHGTTPVDPGRWFAASPAGLVHG